MARPPSGVAAPPQAQLDSRASLSGTEVVGYLDDADSQARWPNGTLIPREWAIEDEEPSGFYKRLIPGYMWPDELDAYLANPPPLEDPPPVDPVVDPAVRRVAAYLGAPDDPDLLTPATEHLPLSPRWRGPTPATGDSSAAGPARTSSPPSSPWATARMMTNPGGLPYSVGETAVRGSFTGWSLAELFVLNRYRKRVA